MPTKNEAKGPLWRARIRAGLAAFGGHAPRHTADGGARSARARDARDDDGVRVSVPTVARDEVRLLDYESHGATT